MAKSDRPRDLVSVFSGRAAEADLIRFVLEEAGIRCSIDQEYEALALPGHTAPAPDVRVLVARADAERAAAEIRRAREDETAAE